MNEEERRLEILKAEVAIRELAGRMAEANECARQADMARNTLKAAVRSIDELNIEFHASIESQRRLRESLDICEKDLQKAQERLEKKTEDFQTAMGEKNQKFYESVDAKLGNLSRDINTISNKLLFLMDQNEASGKKNLALQRIIEELSSKFERFGNDIACNSEEIQELRTQVIDHNEKLSSLKHGLDAKTSGLAQRLQSVIKWSWS
jgi:predicted  nucleic acid-binding Zn-ribbon protein